MRLRRLEISGIGPFAGTFAINFDTLTVGGLFLLEGPTGSGKSTIIDAIAWALYGGVAGGRDSTDDRMRSTHANPSQESYVDLVFSVDAGTFRVRRTPQWIKAGNKNPTNASAKLWRLSESAVDEGRFGNGEILETKPAGTGTAITRLVGLNREQFLQTVILPQGKFADFLKLDSTKRTALLEQIFDTSTYRRVADLLKEKAATAQSKVDSARLEWALAAEGLSTTLRLDAESKAELTNAVGGAHDPADAKTVSKIAETLVLRAERESKEAEETSAQAFRLAGKREEEARAAVELAARVEKRSRLLATQSKLKKNAHEIDGLEDRLAAHALGARVDPFITAFDRAALAHDTAKRAFLLLRSSASRPNDVEVSISRRAYTSHTGSAIAILPASADQVNASTLASQTSALEDMTSLTGRLTELAKAEEGLVASLKERDIASQALDQAVTNVETAQREAASLPQTIEQLEERIAAEEAEAARVESLESKVESLTAALGRFSELERVRKSTEKAKKSMEEAESAFERARLLRDEKTRTWTASISAIMAGKLAPGKACPVCGSPEHPSPAPPSDVKATHDDVEAAENEATAARRRLSEAEKRAATAAAALTTVERELTDLTRDSVVSDLDAAKTALKAALDARTAAAASRRNLKELRRRLDIAVTSLTQAQKEQAAAQERLAGLDSAIELAHTRIEPELAGYETISERLTSHIERTSEQRRAVEAVRELLSARQQLEARESELRDALSEAGFTALASAREALMPPDAVESAKARVAEHRQASHDVARDLAAPEIANLTGQENPDVEGTARLARESAEIARKAQRQADLAQERSSNGRSQLAILSDREAVWAQQRDAASPILRLANLANAGSDSITRIPLATFVVRHRFEQILDRANERLAGISLGRYQLARSDEKERGSREIKTGLGLIVIDRDGEIDGAAKRSPRSLSGGETFYVSLALALALADVVRAENGGITLETLLIDEGFGSLDDSTLDLVMAALADLAEDGRAVGLVSHVSELKKIIAEQITVHPLGNGSSRLEVRC